MSAASFDQLVETLRAQGVIPADAKVAERPCLDRPWFVALMQGVAGWLAGVFLLAFIGLVFKPEAAGSVLILGAVLLAGACLLYHADRDAVFLDQFALALSIAGQVAVGWGLSIATRAPLVTWVALSMLVLQVLVLVIMPNKVARTLAALFACVAWVYAVRFLVQPSELIGGVLFGESKQGAPLGAFTYPAGWLLTWIPLIALTAWLIRHEPRWMSSSLREYARPLLTGLLLGLSLAGIAAEPFTVIALGIEGAGIRFYWWGLLPLLSIALTMYAAYGAFRVRNAGLAGVAILAAMLHMARFYYLFGTTLLWKSAIMLAAGTALLLAGVAIRKHETGGGAS